MEVKLIQFTESFSKSESFADEYHRRSPPKVTPEKVSFDTEKESSSEYWTEQAQNTLKELLNRKTNDNHAKNVIMFLGDGMSIPTVAAARVYLGGEDAELSFDKFPHTGFSKVF